MASGSEQMDTGGGGDQSPPGDDGTSVPKSEAVAKAEGDQAPGKPDDDGLDFGSDGSCSGWGFEVSFLRHLSLRIDRFAKFVLFIIGSTKGLLI